MTDAAREFLKTARKKEGNCAHRQFAQAVRDVLEEFRGTFYKNIPHVCAFVLAETGIEVSRRVMNEHLLICEKELYDKARGL